MSITIANSATKNGDCAGNVSSMVVYFYRSISEPLLLLDRSHSF